MFFRKKKKNKKKEKKEVDASAHQRVVVVSTRAHPNRPSRGRGTLRRQPLRAAKYLPRHPDTVEPPYDRYSSYSATSSDASDNRRLSETGNNRRYGIEAGRRELASARDDVARRGAVERRDDVIKRRSPPPAPPLLVKTSMLRTRLDQTKATPGGALGYRRFGIGDEEGAAASRLGASDDLSEWLSWRMRVNDQLSSFVLRSSGRQGAEVGRRRLPLDDLPPDNMSEETLNWILSRADGRRPATSLDHVSYMIYGVPRIRAAQTRRRSGSLRRRNHARPAPRRRRSSVRACGPRPDDTSCQEESLDFSDEYPWPDQYPERLPTPDQYPERLPAPDQYPERLPAPERSPVRVAATAAVNRRPPTITRGRRVGEDSRRPRLAPRGLTNQQSRLAAGSVARPNNSDMTRTRNETSYYDDDDEDDDDDSNDVNRYVRSSVDPIGSRQSSFKPPGGVPTILSLYNLPNQSQVPLRHVTTKRKSSNK